MATPTLVGGCFGGIVVGAGCIAQAFLLSKLASARSEANENKKKRRKEWKANKQPLRMFDSSESMRGDADLTMNSSQRFGKGTVPPSGRKPSSRTAREPPNAEGENADGVIMEAGWEGFSMEEALSHADSASEKMKQMTPEQVLASLQRGNARFWTHTTKRPAGSAFQRRALLTKQFPSVAVLSCADSRVPIEIVFDQGLGEMFTVRIAGNALDNTTLASLQYAVHHLKVKVVLIMGHEGCGAVKAAGLPPSDLANEPAALQNWLGSLREGMDFNRFLNCHDKRAHDRESVVCNVLNQLDILMLDDGIMAKVKKSELIVIGAFYELSSGIVDFFSKVTPHESSAKENPTLRGVGHLDTGTSRKKGSRKLTATMLPTLDLGSNEVEEDDQ